MENNGIFQGSSNHNHQGSFGSSHFDHNTTTFHLGWGTPILIKTTEVGETIEMMYKETSMITNLSYLQHPYDQRVFKIVYSCQDGKWHKSPPIYGKIIPAVSESYEFE